MGTDGWTILDEALKDAGLTKALAKRLKADGLGDYLPAEVRGILTGRENQITEASIQAYIDDYDAN
ncbi:hypothetical protein [Rhodococcoides fascians]|uniref:hypothetical protein n=1 Tax=Rhodococcoides fascians TaxID=1828 RepID=UPI001E2BD137|nr:hypothetical protein [Rhodococcus fascians]